METFTNRDGSKIVYDLIKVIQKNKQYLSEIDGAIGDGDHGINMNKGFTMAGKELEENPGDLTYSLKVLSRILMTNIGGAMGPLYGMFFRSMARVCEGKEDIDAHIFEEMLKEAEKGIRTIGGAAVGDKTLLDALDPAAKEFGAEIGKGVGFREALMVFKKKAMEGRDSTKDMIAKIGRASRMGERSKGVIDPGAASMCLLLVSMADSIAALLQS